MISTPSGLLLAASTFLTASTNIRRTHADAWDTPDTRSDGVAVKKGDKDVVVPFESVTSKPNDEAALPTSVDKDPSHAVSFEDAIKPTTRKRGVHRSGGKADSGDLDVPARTKVDVPERYDPDQDSLEDFILRVLQGDIPDGSPYACLADGTSCTGDGSCVDSPYLHVEPLACTGEKSCSQSPRIVVGMGSCTGGDPDYAISCFRSPFACIGQYSCISQSIYGACANSDEIYVSDHSCMGRKACIGSPRATIKAESCHEDYACFSSPNIVVDVFSCVGASACEFSGSATIGRYACRCVNCCRNLKNDCMIPDFKCNDDGGPEGDCDFDRQAKNCPTF